MEYPASLLSDARFRSASLAERGLLFQLRLECWANAGRVPSERSDLAKFLGIRLEDLSENLPRIQSFFQVDGDVLRCPELDDYRAYREEESRKKSEGGRKGAAITNAGKARVSRGSLDKYSEDQISQAQYSSAINKEDLMDDDWVSDYDKADRY
jgi:uncharacterized protein YdaU (DUF1376 family)